MQNINTIEDVMAETQKIFHDVLENDAIILSHNTTANDILEWDSLNHIALVVSIEKKFQIQFTAKEIQDFKNVGEMCLGILEKLEKRV